MGEPKNDNLADRIRQHRQVDKRKIVIVEGQSDQLALNRAFRDLNLSYFPAGTRSIALEAARTLSAWKQAYFLCVVDRDFDDELKTPRGRGMSPILAYDNADLEAMLALAGAASDLLAEMGSAEKITNAGGLDTVIKNLFSMIEPVSRLRRANSENRWGLAFDSVKIGSKIDRKKGINLNIQNYCAALSGTSEASPGQALLIKYATGEIKTKSMPVCPRGSAPYFRGRDFLHFLGAALCGYCGSKRPQSVECEHLEEVLRLSSSKILCESDWGREFVEAVAALR